MISDFGKEEFHTLRILVVDDVDELSKLLSDLCHLTRCVWVEEDFLQQVIIFVEHALGHVEKCLDDLWVAEKFQTNLEIAGSQSL